MFHIEFLDILIVVKQITKYKIVSDQYLYGSIKTSFKIRTKLCFFDHKQHFYQTKHRMTADFILKQYIIFWCYIIDRLCYKQEK